MNDTIAVFKKSRMGMLGVTILAAFLLTAVFGPVLIKYDPLVFGQVSEILNPPSSSHVLGTDDMGRDVLAGLVAGSRVSLTVGLTATAISMIIGTLTGLVAGYAGGQIDQLLMRITDVFLVLPWMPLMLVLSALLGSSLWNIIFVIGLTGWAGTARLVRAQTLTIKERQFIERARAIGASDSHIVAKHILPNVFPIVFSNTILITATSILSETTLSFLGMGDSTRPSWGMMLHYAFEAGAASNGAWWYLIPPGLCVLLLVIGFTLIGYTLDEILNPRLRGR